MKFWESGTLNEHANVVLTGFIALFTLVNVIATIFYVSTVTKTSREASAQTDKLISAANIQACAAKSFAASAANINVGIGTAVDKLNLQANKLEPSVGQTARFASATETAKCQRYQRRQTMDWHYSWHRWVRCWQNAHLHRHFRKLWEETCKSR